MYVSFLATFACIFLKLPQCLCFGLNVVLVFEQFLFLGGLNAVLACFAASFFSLRGFLIRHFWFIFTKLPHSLCVDLNVVLFLEQLFYFLGLTVVLTCLVSLLGLWIAHSLALFALFLFPLMMHVFV